SVMTGNSTTAAASRAPLARAKSPRDGTLSGKALVTGFVPGAARNNYSGLFGMQFTVGPAPLAVSSLGRIYINGNTGPHQVKLVRVSDGGDVPNGSATVSLPGGGSPGQFVYAPLSSVVTLAANTAYYLVGQETSGGDQWDDLGPVTAAGAVTVNSAATFLAGFGFTAVGGANNSYVPVNLLYTVAGTPPSVSITAPAPNAAVSGQNVAVKATATPAAGLGIASVQFQVDGAHQGAAVTASPYGIALDTTKLSNGAHSLTAVATDTASVSATSAPVGITVNNSTVAITAPVAGATVPCTVTVKA